MEVPSLPLGIPGNTHELTNGRATRGSSSAADITRAAAQQTSAKLAVSSEPRYSKTLGGNSDLVRLGIVLRAEVHR